MPKFTLAPLALVTLGLTACVEQTYQGIGATYEPIIDTPKNAQYYADLGACQELATQNKYWSGDTKLMTTLGTVAGAVIGSGESREDALLGAAIGGIGGGGLNAFGAKEDRKSIVIRCMQGRGYRVLK